MIAFRTPQGDLDLVNGDIGLIDGPEYARQKIECRLKFFLSEWFLDQREGFPYYRDVLVKSPNMDVVRSDYRQAILSVPGITVVRSLELSLDRLTRTLSVTFDCLYQQPSQAAAVVQGTVKFIIGQS